MKSIIRRLVGPEQELEIEKLKLALSQAGELRDWYRDRCGEMNEALKKKASVLSSEYKRNRQREDALTNQLIEFGGGRRLPSREESVEQPDGETKKLSPVVESDLRRMAEEYAVQKHQYGTPTPEEIETVYEQMSLDPDRWINP